MHIRRKRSTCKWLLPKLLHKHIYDAAPLTSKQKVLAPTRGQHVIPLPGCVASRASTGTNALSHSGTAMCPDIVSGSAASLFDGRAYAADSCGPSTLVVHQATSLHYSPAPLSRSLINAVRSAFVPSAIACRLCQLSCLRATYAQEHWPIFTIPKRLGERT